MQRIWVGQPVVDILQQECGPKPAGRAIGHLGPWVEKLGGRWLAWADMTSGIVAPRVCQIIALLNLNVQIRFTEVGLR